MPVFRQPALQIPRRTLVSAHVKIDRDAPWDVKISIFFFRSDDLIRSFLLTFS
jgi:hypothetical protein